VLSEVGESSAKCRCRIVKAGGIAAQTRHRRIVSNKVVGQLAVDRQQVALRKQRLNELVHDSLVLGCGGHAAIVCATTELGYPNFLG
jgi:hypothetical protein